MGKRSSCFMIIRWPMSWFDYKWHHFACQKRTSQSHLLISSGFTTWRFVWLHANNNGTCDEIIVSSQITQRGWIDECLNMPQMKYTKPVKPYSYQPQGKVMFSEVCVSHSVGGRRVWCHFLSHGPSWGLLTPPSHRVLTSSGGHCRCRYASYWNAFLYSVVFVLINSNQ